MENEIVGSANFCKSALLQSLCMYEKRQDSEKWKDMSSTSDNSLFADHEATMVSFLAYDLQ